MREETKVRKRLAYVLSAWMQEQKEYKVARER